MTGIYFRECRNLRNFLLVNLHRYTEIGETLSVIIAIAKDIKLRLICIKLLNRALSFFGGTKSFTSLVHNSANVFNKHCLRVLRFVKLTHGICYSPGNNYF